MTVVKNLGQIQAVHVGLSAPINTKILWYDDNTGIKQLKYYDTFLSIWKLLTADTTGLWDDRGNYDASSNLFPSTGGSGTAGVILKGDIWTVSVAGTLGGTAVAIGDTVRALTDTPGQTSSNWAIGSHGFGYVPLSNVLADGNVFVGNSSNVATARTLSGDLTITNTGVATVANQWKLVGNTLASRAVFGSTSGVFGWDYKVNNVVVGAVSDVGKFYFSNTITDSSAVDSLNTNTRIAKEASAGVTTLDWNLTTCSIGQIDGTGNGIKVYDCELIFGDRTLKWNTGQCYDGDPAMSLNWFTRTLQVGATNIASWSSATTGIVYSADFSAGYTSRSLIDKGYVSSTYLALAGGTMSGNIAMGGHNLTGVSIITGDSSTLNISGDTISIQPINTLKLSGNFSSEFVTLNTAALSSARTVNFPDADGTFVYNNNSATLTNKTYNGLTVTTTTGTLTLVNGSSLITAGAFSTTLTSTATTNVTLPTTGTLATLAGSEALTNKTVNGLTITSSTGTLTITNGKVLSVSNTLTFTGTDSSSVAFGAGGTVVYTSNNLSVFAATTSAQLAGILSDEVGTGFVVFNDSPTFTTQILSPIVYGSSSSGGNLQLHSTSNATKGFIYFGTGFGYDGTKGFVGIGTQAPTSTLHITQGGSQAAWALAGPGIRSATAIYTDTTSSGSVSTLSAVHVLAAPIIAASSITTYTGRFATLYIEPPTGGTNVTLTQNPRAIYTTGSIETTGTTFTLNVGSTSGLNVLSGGSTRTAYTTEGLQSHSTDATTTGTTAFWRWTQNGNTGGSAGIFLITAGAVTSQTTATNITDINFNLGAVLKQVDGTTALMRGVLITGRTYTPQTTALTITNASVLDVVQSFAGSGTTISSNYTQRWLYDTSNYMGVTMSSIGTATFALTGTSPVFTFNQTSYFLGNIQTVGTADNCNLFVRGNTAATATSTGANLLFAGATSIDARMWMRGSTNFTPAANGSYASFIIGTQAATIAGTGTHALFANMVINPVSITAGAGALTNSASLYINGAATGATNNYSLWVASGAIKLGGAVTLDSTINKVTVTQPATGSTLTLDDGAIFRVMTGGNIALGGFTATFGANFQTLTGSATLDFGNTLAGTATDLTITVTGAALGDNVALGVPNGSVPADGTYFAWVSATNTVTVRFANNSLTLALDPASGTFNVIVFKQ